MIGKGEEKAASSALKDSVGQMWANTFLEAEWVAVLSTVLSVANKTATKAYLVGGIVRECVFSVVRPTLAGKPKNLIDIDFAVIGDFDTFIIEIASALSTLKIDRSPFMTAVCQLSGGMSVDFAHCRTETYKHPGSLPEVQCASLDQDALRRDFSINAIYVPLSEIFLPPPSDFENLKGRIIDYVGGLQALLGGVVEVLHEKSISDDPTRIFRAVRYRAVLSAFALNGTYGEKFLQSQKEACSSSSTSAIKAVSHFRKWNELKKCFECRYPVEGIGDLRELGVFKQWPPMPSEIQATFIARIDRLLTLDQSILTTQGFVIFAALWMWSYLDSIESLRNSDEVVELKNQFKRARDELRLSKPIKRIIEERKLESSAQIDWYCKAVDVYQ